MNLHDFNSLYCPITHEIFIDPVITIADGYTYERKAIIEWLRHKHTSPITGLILSSKIIISNFSLKSLIDEMNKNDPMKLHHELKSNHEEILSIYDWLYNIGINQDECQNIGNSLNKIGGIKFLKDISLYKHDNDTLMKLSKIFHDKNINLSLTHLELINKGIETIQHDNFSSLSNKLNKSNKFQLYSNQDINFHVIFHNSWYFLRNQSIITYQRIIKPLFKKSIILATIYMKSMIKYCINRLENDRIHQWIELHYPQLMEEDDGISEDVDVGEDDEFNDENQVQNVYSTSIFPFRFV